MGPVDASEIVLRGLPFAGGGRAAAVVVRRSRGETGEWASKTVALRTTGTYILVHCHVIRVPGPLIHLIITLIPTRYPRGPARWV